jgi:hypothetical protein
MNMPVAVILQSLNASQCLSHACAFPTSISQEQLQTRHRYQRCGCPSPLLPPLLPKPNSCHRTALGGKRALTLCYGRHQGFKFIHEWRKRSAHRTDTAKSKTQSKSKKWGGMRGGWGLGAGGLHPVPCSKASRVVPICRRFDCICRSARSVVMPHSATISTSGDQNNNQQELGRPDELKLHETVHVVA